LQSTGVDINFLSTLMLPPLHRLIALGHLALQLLRKSASQQKISILHTHRYHRASILLTQVLRRLLLTIHPRAVSLQARTPLFGERMSPT
jgi:hypothetical protein